MDEIEEASKSGFVFRGQRESIERHNFLGASWKEALQKTPPKRLVYEIVASETRAWLESGDYRVQGRLLVGTPDGISDWGDASAKILVIAINGLLEMGVLEFSRAKKLLESYRKELGEYESFSAADKLIEQTATA